MMLKDTQQIHPFLAVVPHQLLVFVLVTVGTCSPPSIRSCTPLSDVT